MYANPFEDRHCGNILRTAIQCDFFSAAANAEIVRSACGLKRAVSECRTQIFPLGTPHRGQRTEETCLGVRAFSVIGADYDDFQPRICPILDTAGSNYKNFDS
jgi:hypothetical protein